MKRRRTGVYYILDTPNCEALFPSRRLGRTGWRSSSLRLYKKTRKKCFQIARRYAKEFGSSIEITQIRVVHSKHPVWDLHNVRFRDWLAEPSGKIEKVIK